MENLFLNPFVLAIVSFLILQLLFMTIGKEYFSVEKWKNLSIVSHPNLYVLIIIVILPFWGLGNFLGFEGSAKLNETSNTQTCGPGDSSCESNVRNHINGISGVELNSISYIQNNDGSPSGKFIVGVLKQDERGINQFSATISTDCNCKVIDAGGIVSR